MGIIITLRFGGSRTIRAEMDVQGRLCGSMIPRYICRSKVGLELLAASWKT